MFTLLIVEDQPLIRAGLKKYFDWESLHVHTIFEAENGEEGKNIALQKKPDIIITDISMPKMDGLEMIERLQRQLPHTQYIILTGFDKFDYAQRAIRTGVVQDFLLKPLQYTEGLSTIARCIENSQQIRSEKEKDVEKEATPQVSKVVRQMLEHDASQHVTTKEILLFEQIAAYILQHIDQGLTLNAIAEHFYYNPSYLSRLFKTKMGRNYISFVTEIKINYAKTLLEDPKNSVADVCHFCGYKSYKHFIKIFKSECYVTPTEYRRSLRL